MNNETDCKQKNTNSQELRSESINKTDSVQMIAIVEDFGMTRIFTAVKTSGNYENLNHDLFL